MSKKYVSLQFPDKSRIALFWDEQLGCYTYKGTVLVGALLFHDGNLYVLNKGKNGYFVIVGEKEYINIYFNEKKDIEDNVEDENAVAPVQKKEYQFRVVQGQTQEKKQVQQPPVKPWKK